MLYGLAGLHAGSEIDVPTSSPLDTNSTREITPPYPLPSTGHQTTEMSLGTPEFEKYNN